MKSRKFNQWLCFLSAFILLPYCFSSLSAFVPPGSLLTSCSFKNFLLNFSLLMILLYLLTHTCLAQHQYFLYCTLTGAYNVQFNNRMPPLSHGLTLTILFHTFHDLNFESLCAFLSFLALGILFSPHSSLGVFEGDLVWGIYEQAWATACTFMYNLVSGERVSDLYNDIWVCNCIIRPSSEISCFHGGYKCRQEEPPPTLPRNKCISSGGKDKQLLPSSTGTFLSPQD